MSAGGATGEPLGYVTLPDWPEIAVSREREWNCDRDGYITVSHGRLPQLFVADNTRRPL